VAKAQLVLDFLKVLSSPQIIVSFAVIVFLFWFRADLKALIGRIAMIKFPGGGELHTSQLERTKEDLPPKGEVPPPTPAEGSAAKPDPASSASEAKDFKDRYEAERAKAYLWEYRYLNLFLAPMTQRVLDWFAGFNGRTTLSAADSYWLPFISVAQERIAIMNALQAHYLIIINNDFVEITPKGREYIQWRGPLSKR
jgi:hypothetical protein